VIAQTVDLVIGNKFKAIEIVGMPAGTEKLHFELAKMTGGFDRSLVSGMEFALTADDPQRPFERLVVEIARSAELRIEGVLLVIRGVGKKIVVSMQQRRAVKFQRRVGPRLLNFLGSEICKFGDRVMVFAVRLAALDLFNLG